MLTFLMFLKQKTQNEQASQYRIGHAVTVMWSETISLSLGTRPV